MSEELEGYELDAALGQALGNEPSGTWYVVRCNGLTIGPTASRQQAEEVLRSEQQRWPEREYRIEKMEVHPEYSTTWEGLGLVAEEMERQGWTWQLLSQRVLFTRRINDRPAIIECPRDPLAPLMADIATSTARAALKALEARS